MSADTLSAGSAAWLESNQALLVAEFAHIKNLLSGSAKSSIITESGSIAHGAGTADTRVAPAATASPEAPTAPATRAATASPEAPTAPATRAAPAPTTAPATRAAPAAPTARTAPGATTASAAPATPAATTAPAAINRLCELFGLTAFERNTLLLCAGVEMDSRVAALCGEALGYAQRSQATFGLAMAIFPDPEWGALLPNRPLRAFRLIDMAPAVQGLTSAPLRIDERVLHYLAGLEVLDTRLVGMVQEPMSMHRIAPSHLTNAARSAASAWPRLSDSDTERALLVHLCGDDPDGQEDVASAMAAHLQRRLFVIRSSELPAVGPDLDQFTSLWAREAQLLGASLLIQCSRSEVTPAARWLAERIHGPVLVASRESLRFDRPFIRNEVNKPPPREQLELWHTALGARAADVSATLDELSEQFRMSARTIATAGRLASRHDPVAPAELWEICKTLCRPKLEDLAQRLVAATAWDDLVLPDPQQETLRHLTTQVRHQMTVYETWGFSAKSRRGLGVSALFTGESGTGKTLAAEVIAHELRLDLYRIDLSSVVSKYIGETEKNLKQLFDVAEEGGVMLLFDEADALFGKRSEVRDSHDRYANIEVGYLLQRMEAFAGLAILTTNLKASLDKAFQRRLRFIVHFPFPDARQREQIWARAFPSETPTRDLDFRKLAQLNMTGGNIRNIALNAAFLAAADPNSGGPRPVAMDHVLHAARLESSKMERPLADAEVRGWV
jgi:hypothetical protein